MTTRKPNSAPKPTAPKGRNDEDGDLQGTAPSEPRTPIHPTEESEWL